MNNRSTLKKIAEQTHYSLNTVSKALNNKYGVSAKTKKIILDAAEQCNYKPNFFARGIRGVDSNLIGLVVGDITNQYFMHVLTGVEAVANSENMNIIICNSSEDVKKEEKAVDILSSYNCSGIVICPVASNTGVIHKLIKNQTKFVALDTQFDESIRCDQVSVRIRSDFFRATEYLLSCGHRRIGFINSDVHFKTVLERQAGYEQALAGYGIENDPDLIGLCKDDPDAKRVCDSLLELPNRPTAIIVARESYGLNTLASIINHGLKIHDDISLLVYGSPDWATAFNPAITCMQRPVAEMAHMGTKMLIEKCRNHEENSTVHTIALDSQLIIRESVRFLTPSVP